MLKMCKCAFPFAERMFDHSGISFDPAWRYSFRLLFSCFHSPVTPWLYWISLWKSWITTVVAVKKVFRCFVFTCAHHLTHSNVWYLSTCPDNTRITEMNIFNDAMRFRMFDVIFVDKVSRVRHINGTTKPNHWFS